MNKLIISLAAAILSLPVAADEGMWLLPLLKGQRFPEMQALGLKLQDYDIYSPDSASLKRCRRHFRRRLYGRDRFAGRIAPDQPSLRLRLHPAPQHAGT